MEISRSLSFFKTLENHAAELLFELQASSPVCGYPVYASMDIRDAGWKIAVVDVNLFPAGFNNLSASDKSRGAQCMKEFFSAKLLKTPPWKIVVVPEAHTNNPGYLENLAGILTLLKEAGCEARLLWPGFPSIPKPWILKTTSGSLLEYLPAEQALLGADALLLNHDMSGGVPKIIQNVSLPTFPSTNLGWYKRKKSTHQEIVTSLLRRLEKKFSFFDSWYLSAESVALDHVDFSDTAGLDKVAGETSKLLQKIAKEYAARGIEEQPHVYIKNDSGTYGMGIITVNDAQQLFDEASAVRRKMKKGKESVPISKVIIQEGVPTAFTYPNPSSQQHLVVGEPSVYLINGVPVGGFMRIHETLPPASGRFENLNQPGSVYEPLDCSSGAAPKHPFPKSRGLSPCELSNSQKMYGFLSKLHMIAAGLEDCPHVD